MEFQTLDDHLSSKIIWKESFHDPKGGAIEVAATMGSFAWDKFDYVSILNKELDEEREKNTKIQNEKETLNQQIE